MLLPTLDIGASGAKAVRLAGWLGSRDYYSNNGPFTPPEKREWWIYFIQGDDGGPIKIGRTTNLIARLSDLQIGYPFGRLRFVGLKIGLPGEEPALHARFSQHRLSGEWFSVNPELCEFIAALPREVTP